MPPGQPATGLLIFKLGIQATAIDEVVRGVICLKVTLPREVENGQIVKYTLFPGATPPRITSRPEIQPLPLTPSSSSPNTVIARRLLSLAGSYPPSQTGQSLKPFIEVSSSGGQVSLILDSRRNPPRKDGIRGGRRDWLVCLPFEVSSSKHGSTNQVLLGLPKCLDNVVRFQIIPSPDGPSDHGEVSMLTEPRVHPLPPSAFSRSSGRRHLTQNRSVGLGSNNEREDGQGMGHSDVFSDGEEVGTDSEDDSEGCWLEGRFQCTETLRLEWSSGSSGRGNVNRMKIEPNWNKQSSSISLYFESTIISKTGTVGLEAIIPQGWGWRELDIRGKGVKSWRPADGQWVTMDIEHGDTTLGEESMTQVDDSFSTYIQRNNKARQNPTTPSDRPSTSAASLLRQRMPAHLGKMEDYSFEVGDASIETSRPVTPMARSSPLAWNKNDAIGHPSPSSHADTTQKVYEESRFFELILTSSTAVTVQGTLVPISELTFISPTLPIQIPYIRIDHGSSDSKDEGFEVECPTARIVESQPQSEDSEQLGHFTWLDESGKDLIDQKTDVDGDVDVRLVKDVWGKVSLNARCRWPSRAKEIAFFVPSKHVRLIAASIDGKALPRQVFNGEEGMEIRLGPSQGGIRSNAQAEFVLEVESVDEIPLPVVQGEGSLLVHLQGDNWNLNERRLTTNLSASSPTSWKSDRSSTIRPMLTLSPETGVADYAIRQRAKGLLSWSTLFNLFMAYIIISLAVHVQNLRNEVAFVAEEARDLRLYGYTTILTSSYEVFPTCTSEIVPSSTSDLVVSTETSTSTYDFLTPFPTTTAGLKDVVTRVQVNDIGTSVGRVVFGKSAWDKWVSHPTVRTIGNSLTWVWSAFVWLVVP